MHALIALTTTLCLAETSGGAPDVLERLREDSRAYAYEQPNAADVQVAKEMFALLLRPERDLDRVVALCVQLHLDLLRVREGEQRFLIIAEPPDRRMGRGFFVFRTSPAVATVLQAPHAFYDVLTGDIVHRLFMENRALAAAWNTASRRVPIGDSEHVADLAHLKRSYFQAFTEAVTEAKPEVEVIQLHGFTRSKRTSPQGKVSDIILSNGTRKPPARLSQSVECLEQRCGAAVSLFPRDVNELGGTTNTQVRAFRRAGRRGFLHVELSRPLRERLARDARTRLYFWHCLAERAP